MSFLYPELDIPCKEKSSKHPWEKIIKSAYAGTYKYGHNSARNPIYPPPKKSKEPSANRVKFTVIGTRTTREFLYCMNLVKGLHKYRWRYFDAPIITEVTSAAWPKTWSDLKIQYGGEAYCLQAQVAVILNDQFLGGDKELKELIESKYIYYIKPDNYVEATNLFTNYINATGRPCACIQIMIDTRYIGMMIFMLYSDLVPRTCENFLRLCKETKGGYSGTPVHRIVKDSWIQCGGYGLKETNLCCENFTVPHDKRGVIAMANDGRHVNCSTQFFVLLQPQDWMEFKYVAFGQLISGEDILTTIEKVPTWYESPKKKIIICKTSILNLECEDITVNKGSNKYIEGHIENLITIGELFYEALLEKVFLEIQFRSLQRIQDEMIMHVESEITPEEVVKNLHTTQRFMRKKEEIDKQIAKSEGDRSGKTTPALTVNTPTEKGENNDFDVEEYEYDEYQAEEYSYQQASAVVNGSLVVKPEKPFYIPLTDVPYPGEVSSEFDLKRLLQGDYCNDIDIDKEAGKKKKKTVDEKIMFQSEVLKVLQDTEVLQSVSSSSTTSEQTVDSYDVREIRKYIQDNADHASFSIGKHIKSMARRGTQNLLAIEKQPDRKIVDESLRQYKVAEYELKRGRERNVSISVPPDSEARKEIIRRQTGFVRPEDLARMRQFEREDDDDYSGDSAELDDYLPYTRQVSVQQPQSITNYKRREHRKHGSERKEKTIKVDAQEKSSEELPLHESDVEFQKRQNAIAWKKGGVPRGTKNTEFEGKRRISVLSRLIDEVDISDQGPGPTLKDYRPFMERQPKSIFLLTYSPEKYQDLKNTSDDSRELYLNRRRHPVDLVCKPTPMDQLLHINGKRVYRKISTDYVKTIDRIEKKELSSLRSLEYAKQRPAISITDYQKRNKEYEKSLTGIPKPSTESMFDKKTKPINQFLN